MTDSYLFPPRPRASLPVVGRAKNYAVERIFCVGRNYAAHAREMGANPENEDPLFFRKSATALTWSGRSGQQSQSSLAVPYPPGTSNFHHEVELVVALGEPCFQIAPTEALNVVFGYTIGLDMTRRDLQAAAKARCGPWAMAKDFEHSAIASALMPVEDLVAHPTGGTISLDVNGQRRQEADLAEQIWTVDEIVARLSRYHVLGPGDLIFTGTPAGVGPVQTGDTLFGEIAGLGNISVTIVPAKPNA